MSDSLRNQEQSEPQSIAEWVDQIADRYEAAWQGVTPPRLEEFLGDATGEHRDALLAELKKIDRAYREHFTETANVRAAQGIDVASPTPLPSDRKSASANSDWPRIPGYEILGELGRGGMGVVYKARHLRLKRLVALKMISAATYVDPRAAARFRTEMEAVARLQHPHIVQLFEVGEQDGRSYCALEYVDGGSLADRLASTPQPPRPAAEVIESLARAVHYAHQQGIIHRDLKPANVLLQIADLRSQMEEQSAKRDPTSAILNLQSAIPKITDFGLAKQLDTELPAYQTQTGEILGTPSYMAPEQAEGIPQAIGPATDIYALGAILYEMLTGRPPFKGESTLETLEQVRSQEPVPPSHLQPKLPRDLSTICLKAMAKNPERRYATAGAVAEDLRRFLEGKAIVARPVGSGEKLWRWCRRNPAVACLTATVAFLLLAVALVGAAMAYQGTQLAEQESNARKVAEQNLQRERELLSEASHAKVFRGHLLLEGGNSGGLLELMYACKKVEDIPEASESRGLLWSGWYAACKHRLEWVVGHDDEVSRVAFAPDGELLATASNKTVRLWKTATGRPHGGVLQLLAFRDMTFSPDGKTLAVATSESTLRLWDTSTCQPLDKGVQAEGQIQAVRFSPDGKLLAIVSEKETGLWDTDTWQRRVPVFQHHHEGTPLPAAIAFKPDGSLLAVGEALGTVHLLQTATGNSHCQPLCHGRPGNVSNVQIMGVAFSPDGKRLVTGSRHNTARLWDVDTGQPHGEVMKHQEHVWGVAFSPKGNLVATVSYDSTAQLWDAETGTPRGPPLRHEGPVAAVAFNADGSLLATCSFDTTARLWDAATGQLIGMPLRHQGGVRSVAFKGDGSLVATASGDRTARLWRMRPENPQLWSAPHSDRVYDIAFSPDGKDLLTGTEDGVVQLLDATTGKCRGQPLQLPAKGVHPVVSVAISADGKLMAANGQPVRIWERDTRRLQDNRLPLENAWVVRFSPKGKLLALGPTGGGAIHLWDLENKKSHHELVAHQDRVESLAFSPDGELLLSGSDDKTAVLWNVTSGQQRYMLPHPEGVEAVAISPDGKLLATACKDLTVRFWEAETGQPAGQPFRYHTRISALAFSLPDGKMLATASWDGTCRLWALPVGLPCGPPYRHELVANSVAFSPDGTSLATGSFDRTARLWRVPGLINDMKEIQLRTYVALGARLNDQGVVEAIPWSEWQALREELRDSGKP